MACDVSPVAMFCIVRFPNWRLGWGQHCIVCCKEYHWTSIQCCTATNTSEHLTKFLRMSLYLYLYLYMYLYLYLYSDLYLYLYGGNAALQRIPLNMCPKCWECLHIWDDWSGVHWGVCPPDSLSIAIFPLLTNITIIANIIMDQMFTAHTIKKAVEVPRNAW